MIIRILLQSVALISVLGTRVRILIGRDDLVGLLHRLQRKQLQNLSRRLAHRRQQVDTLGRKVAAPPAPLIVAEAPAARVRVAALLLQHDQVAPLQRQQGLRGRRVRGRVVLEGDAVAGLALEALEKGDDELADVVRVARREGVVVALDRRQREVLRVALAGSAN